MHTNKCRKTAVAAQIIRQENGWGDVDGGNDNDGDDDTATAVDNN